MNEIIKMLNACIYVVKDEYNKKQRIEYKFLNDSLMNLQDRVIHNNIDSEDLQDLIKLKNDFFMANKRLDKELNHLKQITQRS
jgi:hypothetical protein